MPQPGIPHPKLRGEWAELRFLQRALEQGFRLNKPWGETSPYDVATDYQGGATTRMAAPPVALHGWDKMQPAPGDFASELRSSTNPPYSSPPTSKKSKYAPHEEARHHLPK